MKNVKNINKRAIAGAIAFAAFILLSPKWLIPMAAWIAPAFLLYCIRNTSLKRGIISGWLILSVSTIIAWYQVMPVPVFILPVFALIGGFIALLPYLADRMLHQKAGPLLASMVLPAGKVIQEWLEGFGGSGTWTSIAYTQTGNEALMQLASITGVWGITFFIYWFASIAVILATHPTRIKKTAILYTITIVIVLLFGQFRLTSSQHREARQVMVAGIATDHLELLEQIYFDHTGEHVDLPLTLSQSAPEFQKASGAMVPFIEDPDAPGFGPSLNKLKEIQDELLLKSERAALAGASIISWSEANALVLKSDEKQLINKGRALAQKHGVYLLMSIGAILPGPVTKDRKLIENKIVTVGPDGTIKNIFFKNKPVPGEPSVPGDGKVPVVETEFGRLAVSICYDADFPALMRQTGKQQADILFLPSGDWYAIDPYHAQMALLRGIENGCSVVRPARGGSSVASDPYGRLLASTSFYPQGSSFMLTTVSSGSIQTAYGLLGDWLPWLCLFFISGIIVKTLLARKEEPTG